VNPDPQPWYLVSVALVKLWCRGWKGQSHEKVVLLWVWDAALVKSLTKKSCLSFRLALLLLLFFKVHFECNDWRAGCQCFPSANPCTLDSSLNRVWSFRNQNANTVGVLPFKGVRQKIDTASQQDPLIFSHWIAFDYSTISY
jgi:hypothetical protein